ncbi:MAG: alpha-glucan family phosphorylase, partial [Proteobacteria bacterium]|nr:alpha-glucan family phosphorylase [Pseudomonadota bacterium]
MSDFRQRLDRLSRNLWCAWTGRLDRLFRGIDEELWRRVNHNPMAFLAEVPEGTMAERAHDTHVAATLVRMEKALDRYLRDDQHWAYWNAPGLNAFRVAYFSPEFALHESLPIYSGGLGVLAGDHLKSCSDLGIPAMGVTLLYRQGYFTQELDADGQQHEVYQELDTDRVPIEAVRDASGNQITIKVPLDREEVPVLLWRSRVGRAQLLLLDPQRVAGSEFQQAMRLYGGDRTTRILQEVILGVGGYRALASVGQRPGVIHLNEGHSAFAVLEAIADRMRSSGRRFEEVAGEVSESVVFTTHTPVAAGHDRFPPDLALRFLQPLRQRLGLDEHKLLALGRVRPERQEEEFCMTTLALKLARRSNGVSSLHGYVSRRMWQELWPRRRPSEVPIGHVTNGAHVDTWLANEIAQLYSDCLGAGWRTHLCRPDTWRHIEHMDESELWTIKVALKRRLLDFVARRHQRRRERLGVDDPRPRLRSDRLTIGVARRFATYKRALLMFEDLDRVKALITGPERPVQFIFAGKAHPADGPGKALLRRLCELSRLPELRDHVVVVENY